MTSTPEGERFVRIHDAAMATISKILPLPKDDEELMSLAMLEWFALIRAHDPALAGVSDAAITAVVIAHVVEGKPQ